MTIFQVQDRLLAMKTNEIDKLNLIYVILPKRTHQQKSPKNFHPGKHIYRKRLTRIYLKQLSDSYTRFHLGIHIYEESPTRIRLQEVTYENSPTKSYF